MSIESERLKKARESAGFETATDAAKALGMSKFTYAQYESGTRGFRKHVRRLATKFKVPVGWLLGGPGEGLGGRISDPGADLSPEGQRQLEAYAEFLKAQERNKR